ncbi:MAG: hypothetical protein PHE33_04075 [Bacteroidales bacterium]|nr:hypothetical protein [Bacteroidales bacterium]
MESNKNRLANPHSQAQLQFARANAQTQNSNRAFLSATAFMPTLKTNFFGNSSASIELIYDYKRLDN